ncbi:unnamed protein product [Vicia faba]|uniref:TF-B3 domain-containing protein n=1 Tax=Vicia faba TaxID=3906 RepID=A0AAV0YF72_VICFA|nr:unnamed protein product [Vicia faba]
MGGVCRGWEEDIYWTHFQFIHFTQFLRSDFHQQLALPKTFSNNIKKNLPESVTLKGPAGMLWNIELTTKGDTLYFTHGWQQFMKEHSLKENDFLVFKYNGESLFEVLIFDGGSLCEKAACYFVRKCWQAVNTEQGGGCSGRKRDSDNSVEEVKTPNGVDEDVSPEKSLHVNSIRVPIDVPVETTNGKTSNAGVESASAEPFMPDAVPDTEPKTVPSQTTAKRTRRRPVCADTSVPTKKRGRRPNTDNSVEDINTPNGVDEGVSPEKSLHVKSIRVPIDVPVETTNGKTSNAGVESASAEPFIPDAVPDTEPKTVPSQTTAKRMRRRPVCAESSVPTKKRGRRPKTDNSVEDINTPNGVDEDVSPEKSLHVNSIRVPIDVPVETTNGKTSNAGVESAPAEQFMSDAVTDTEPKTVPSKITGKRTRRKPVYADMSVPIKKRGRPAKPPNSHKRAHDCVSGVELSPKVSPKASPKVGFRTKELYTSNRRPVTKNEIENTLQLAQATCAEDTLLVTMRPTHVYKRFFVSFPNKWRINHLSPSSQDVILRMGKSEWLGKYRYHNIRNNGGLTGGWKYFALENNLEEFDVCLFKPAGYMDKTLILEITIFRVVEEITPLTAVNSPQKKSSIKKTPTGLNSREKKSSFKKTPTSAVQTELESFEPLVKKRGVNITVTSAVQTELDSIEGA